MYAERRLTTRRRLKQPDPRMLDDDLMVEHALQDIEAFATIYDRYSTQVYRMCLRAVGDRDLAEDLAAKAFLTVMEKLHQYEPRQGSTFRSWLFVVTRNTVHDYWRRSNRLVPLPDTGWDPPDDAIGPEDLALHRITLHEVRAVLRCISCARQSYDGTEHKGDADESQRLFQGVHG